MSTILIDRRTAALLGELAADAAPESSRPQEKASLAGSAVAVRRSRAVDGRVPALPARSSSPTRRAAAAESKNSRDGGGVTVRRPGARGTAVQRQLRCSPRASAATVAVEVRPARRPARRASAPKPTLHLTRRGRLVAVLILLVLVTLAFSVGRVTSTALGAANGPGHEVVVEQGDTLWSIAERLAPDSDPRTVANDLMALNGLASPSLEIGQHLRLP
jgi:LysM repeat protein